MPILFREISSAPSINSNAFVDIPGLELKIPPASNTRYALVTLNVPTPFAKGSDFPGIDFAIEANGKVIASGGFTYPIQAPASFARVPFTLLAQVALDPSNHTHVKAQWKSVRSSSTHIDSYACIAAVLA